MIAPLLKDSLYYTPFTGIVLPDKLSIESLFIFSLSLDPMFTNAFKITQEIEFSSVVSHY